MLKAIHSNVCSCTRTFSLRHKLCLTLCFYRFPDSLLAGIWSWPKRSWGIHHGKPSLLVSVKTHRKEDFCRVEWYQMWSCSCNKMECAEKCKMLIYLRSAEWEKDKLVTESWMQFFYYTRLRRPIRFPGTLQIGIYALYWRHRGSCITVRIQQQIKLCLGRCDGGTGLSK